jgi:Tfp pilus assembly protein PilF
VKRSTESPEAHDFYLQGRFFFEKRGSANLTRAQNYFERAIKKDSSYALAFAGLSEVYSQQTLAGQALPRDNFPKAKAYAAHALELDSTLAEVHTALAFIALWYDWDWAAAGREFATALKLNPGYSPAHRFHAFYYLSTDSLSAAIGAGRLAVRLDPFSSLSNARLASILSYAGLYREALDQALTTFELDSTFLPIRAELARAYLRLDRCEQALAALAALRGAEDFQGTRGYVYAKCNRRGEALAELDSFRAHARAGKYVTHYALATIQAGLGDTEQAFAELDSAYAERAWRMFLLKREPQFEGLRSDPRFAVLLRKVGLVP